MQLLVVKHWLSIAMATPSDLRIIFMLDTRDEQVITFRLRNGNGLYILLQFIYPTI